MTKTTFWRWASAVFLLLVAARIDAQERAIHLDDDFSYELVDYGVGAVEACPGRTSRVDGVFWIRIKLTNASEHLLKTPRLFSSAAITDNWGNRYTRTHLCGPAKSDRYKPNESAIEVVTISAKELVSDVQELRLTFGTGSPDDTPGFAIREPLKRHHNLSRRNDSTEPLTSVQIINAPNRSAPTPEVVAPRVLHEVHPNYTSDAMRAKVQGSVTLELLVRADGTVGEVRILKSLDPTFGLDQEAIKAAKLWRFAPGTKDGRAVDMTTTIELTFTLQ